MVSQYLNCWKQYFNIKGRTNRKDFFGFVILDLILFVTLVLLAINFEVDNCEIDFLIFYYCTEIGYTALGLYFLVGICPRVSIYIRRIRDTGRDPNWILWCIFPVIGWFIIFIFSIS